MRGIWTNWKATAKILDESYIKGGMKEIKTEINNSRENE